MKRKVLVIEDEPVIAEMMSILLEIDGYKVSSLADTTSAKRRLHEQEVGLVLLDLSLSGGESGQAMCSYIKSEEKLKHLPVIPGISQQRSGTDKQRLRRRWPYRQTLRSELLYE
ncbi:response regulator [Mucilaginibacter sp. S1162]|uniref:Response regulator n=1 Tax=Mucilaginibacter humi TaxID=2732510 RepID=A0ABX1W355_9SPHI|nr:response regulator [Mucilaginibacter humi]NNU34289.1 response regulator [Mucilaginibacter humi]